MHEQAAVASRTIEGASEAMQSMFEPDVLLPAQFFDANRRRLSGGEKRLMEALLVDGVEAYIAASMRRDNDAPIRDDEHGSFEKDARYWVHGRDGGYVFSFDNVCAALGLDPDYIRRGLMAYVGAQRLRRKAGLAFGWRKIRRPRK